MRRLFTNEKVIIEMVHPPAMPGFPGYGGDMNSLVAQAVTDARTLARGGADGIIVENLFNRPRQRHGGPDTVAPMTLAMKAVVDAVDLPIGIKVLFNDAKAELAIAHCTGAPRRPSHRTFCFRRRNFRHGGWPGGDR